MDCNVLDYELAGCPVAGSATASGGFTRRTLESQLPGLPALGLQPNGAEARANTDNINSSLSATGERERECQHVCVWMHVCCGKSSTYWKKGVFTVRMEWYRAGTDFLIPTFQVPKVGIFSLFLVYFIFIFLLFDQRVYISEYILLVFRP